MVVTFADRACAAVAVMAIALAGCAPDIDGPVERQRAIDRDDGDRLAAQLAQLPGAVTASVLLHHPRRDPLGEAAAQPASFTAVIAIDDRADLAMIRAAAARLAHAALPELPATTVPAIEVHVSVHRPVLAKVGPFSVEEASATALKVALALACLAIAGLAGALAAIRRQRLGNSAQ